MAQNRFGNQVAEPASPEPKPPEQRRAPAKPRREPNREIPADDPPRQRFTWRPKPLFQLLKATYSEYTKDKVPRMGAALAYYTIFSLAPLLVITIAIAGFLFGREARQRRLMGVIQGLFGA